MATGPASVWCVGIKPRSVSLISVSDKDGIALIICEVDLEQKYRALVQGKTILESTLHTNLAEHLNSEIGLGTIKSISTAKEWLRGSFLFQRLQKNPNHYSLGKDDNQTWEERVDDLVLQSVERLRQTQLVETPINGTRGDELISTDFGDIMSKLYIRQSTMGLILALPERPTLRDILEMISCSEECVLFNFLLSAGLMRSPIVFRLSEIKLRSSEKIALNKLRRHSDIRFEMKKLEKTADKVLLLIQAVLGGISLNSPEYKSADSQPQLEAFGIFRHVSRISRAIVEVGVFKQLGAQAWEDRPVVLRQLEQIGEKSIKARVLAEHGIVSIPQLLKQDALRIETLLNRRSPFGLELLASARELPQYSLTATQINVTSNGGKGPVEAELSVHCGIEHVQEHQSSKVKKLKGSSREKKTFSVTVELTRPSQTITVLITSETIAGLVVRQSYKPALPSSEFPTRNTRPPTATDIDLEGLEDDPDFWDMDVGEEVLPVIRDLTKPKPGNAKGEKTFSPSKTDRSSCRDGLPPKTKKRTSSARPTLESPKISQIATGTAKPKVPNSRMAEDRRLKQLESLHERSSATSNLQLSPGRRLKLDSPSVLKRKRKPIPDFKMEYAELKDPKDPCAVENTGYDSPKTDDDDDDLPEAPGLFSAKKPQTSLSDDNYSNSDIDSLIRAIPLDADNEEAPALGGQKRKRTIEPSSTRKRMRIEKAKQYTLNGTDGVGTQSPESPSRVDHVEHINEDLFLSCLSDELEENFYDDREPYEVGDSAKSFPGDDSLLSTSDCLNIRPTTPDLTKPSVLDSFEHSDFLPIERNTSLMITADKKEKDEDDFAELDAWLNSGAVEIL
ncbi:hypothetical protein DXG01_008991 [Tephrocybe rancida]|nr:hypothetical protein DXG01_008991 [Tephrocybe rancida]